MSIPWSALIAGGLGTAALVRAFYRPIRAIIADGYVGACPLSSGCSPKMVIAAYTGAQPVYAVASGNVVSVAGDTIAFVPDREAVVIVYEGLTQISASPGQHLAAGTVLGLSSKVTFSVVLLDHANPSMDTHYEPASWLAVRGIRISEKDRRGSTPQWCEGGRTIAVPQAASKCNLVLPEPSAFSLLPVRITLS